MSSIFTQDVVLQGQAVQLEPLRAAHAAELSESAAAGDLWQTWYTAIPAPDKMQQEIARRLSLQQAGSMLPFAVRNQLDGKVCGMTTYMHIDSANRRVEIGSTWLAKRVQRSAINTEMKFLMLEYAFEKLACIAVEFRTHFMNFQSRAAISRLGAKQDGILRNAQISADGAYRDTVVFSIIESEWPAVRMHLRHKMQQGPRAAGE